MIPARGEIWLFDLGMEGALLTSDAQRSLYLETSSQMIIKQFFEKLTEAAVE